MKTVLDHATEQASLYDADFYIWTQKQAALLRQVPRGSFALDIDNLAEEIESMGRSDLNKVSSLLRQVLIHLLKLAIEPDSLSRTQWVSEVMTFQYEAALAFTPGMKQRLEIEQIWKTACSATARHLESAQLPVPAWPAVCHVNLDDLLVTDFDLAPTAARVKAALQPAQAPAGRR